jgi:glycosyltransferase involved in cell wall biosynthesis
MRMSYKKKVVFLATSNFSVNIFYLPQMKKLSDNGFEIELICGIGTLSQQVHSIVSEVHVIRNLKRNFSGLHDIFALIEIIKSLKKSKPNLVIYATPKAALIGSLAACVLKINFRIYQIWGIRWQNLSGLARILVKSADLISVKLSTNVIVVSNSVLSYLEDNIDVSKMKVLGNGSTAGINTDVFYIGNKEKLKSKNIILGYAGRIAKDKGIEDLVGVFEKLSSNREISLEIIGDLDLADLISQDIMVKIKNNSKIRWINFLDQKDLAERMRHWQAQIFLSKREGLGNVILEAGACGVPTFCWDTLGTKDAIPDFAKFFLVEIYNDSVLIQRINKYLKQPFSAVEKQEYSNWYINYFNQELVLESFYNYIKALEVK